MTTDEQPRDLADARAEIGRLTEQLVDTFASMGAGLYVTDTTGQVVLANAEAERLLLGPGLVGRNVHATIHHHRPDGSEYPVGDCPLLDVSRTGSPASSDTDTFFRADGSPLPVSWFAAPLRRDGTAIGTVAVFTDSSDRAAAAERLRQRLADQEQAQDELSEAFTRLLMLSRLGDAVSTLDGDEALRRLARFAVGSVADAAVVDSYDEGRLRRIAIATTSGDLPEDLEAGSLPLSTTASVGSLAQVVRTGQSTVVDVAAETTSDDPLDLAQSAMFRTLGARHAVVVPLVARGTVLGAMTWTGMGPFDDTTVLLAQEAGRRAALALDNARLHEQARRTGEVLQRAMLSTIPAVPGLQLVARYLPAASGAEVGGDWYDVLPLEGGSTYVVIGDIVGHDLVAAAAMGQLRMLLRALVYDRREGPADLLRRLDETAAAVQVDTLATVLLAEVRPRRAGGCRVTVSSAGHPPAMVLDAAGSARTLDGEPDLMLGVDPTVARTEHSADLGPGDTLLLYTDGLIERPGESLDVGLTRLRQAATGVAGEELESAAYGVIRRMLPDEHPDDVALLALRVD